VKPDYKEHSFKAFLIICTFNAKAVNHLKTTT
jgi:hypothetical protein